MKIKFIKEVQREHVKIAGTIDEIVGVAHLHNSLMQQELISAIQYQFEYPIVFERDGCYQAIANFLPLISQRYAPSQRISVIVIDYRASIVKKVASEYMLHVLSFQTTNELFYPIFEQAILLNKNSGKNPHLRNMRCSQRGLADLLKVHRQTVRTYTTKIGSAR